MKGDLIPQWPLWHRSFHNDFLDVSWQRLMIVGKVPQASRLVGEEDLCQWQIHLPCCPFSLISHSAHHAHTKTVKSKVWTVAKELSSFLFGLSNLFNYFTTAHKVCITILPFLFIYYGGQWLVLKMLWLHFFFLLNFSQMMSQINPGGQGSHIFFHGLSFQGVLWSFAMNEQQLCLHLTQQWNTHNLQDSYASSKYEPSLNF